MARAFSFNFITQNAFIGGGVQIVTFPSGFRYVIRDIDAFGVNTGIGSCPLEFQTFGVRFARFSVPAGAAMKLQWQGRVVVPGDPGPYSIVVSAPGDPGATFEFTINGYQLTLP